MQHAYLNKLHLISKKTVIIYLYILMYYLTGIRNFFYIVLLHVIGTLELEVPFQGQIYQVNVIVEFDESMYMLAISKKVNLQTILKVGTKEGKSTQH